MFLSLFFIIPIVVFSVCFYFSFLIFNIGYVSIILASLLSITISYIFLRRASPKKPSWLLSLLAVLLLFATAIVLSPLVLTINLHGFTFITYPSATDYFKHLYTITSLIHFGIPPQHPYFPPGLFSYYFGYYLIPAAFSYVLPQMQNWILYIYVLFTNAISLLFLVELYGRFIKRARYSLLAIFPALFGLGWDIIPTLIDGHSSGGRLIELWSISHGLQLRIDNPFTAFLWTPQHFMSAIIALVIVYLLLFTNNRNLLLYLFLYLFLLLGSIFVFIPVILFTLVYFILYPSDRNFLFRTGLTTFLFSLPFLFYLGGRGGLFIQFVPGVFPFFHQFILDRVATWFIEYGPLLFFLPVWLFFFTKKLPLKSFFLLSFMSTVPILITWFVRSPNYNDFALRSILPLQLVLPLMAGWLITKSANKFQKYLLIILIVINAIGGTPGFVYEFASRWKERGVLDVNTSEMLIAVRKLPFNTTLAAVGRDEWIYQLPALGFKPVLTSNLYDSANYLDPSLGNLHSQYEVLEQEIFSTQTIGKDLNSTLDQRNSKLAGLSVFFSAFKYDYLIVKKDDPWYAIFKTWDVQPKPLTPQYSLLSHNQLKNHSLQISSSGTSIVLTSKQIELPAGVWFLVSCNPSVIPYQALIIDDKTIFQGSTSKDGCIGNFYSNEAATHHDLTKSTIANLIAYPLITK